MHSKTTNTKGITLVEVLITLIIAAFIAAATLTFVNISGKSTDELAAQQVLQQESSMISERFLRSVRRGESVGEMKGGNCIIPESIPIDDVTHIRINYPNQNNNIEVQIVANMMQITEGGKTRNISTRLCTADISASTFTIQPFGRGVKLILTLEYTTKKDKHTFTTTIGSVRCKNTIK